MKFVCLFSSFLLACLAGSAQGFQKVPLQTVIADAPNDFAALRGNLHLTSDDDSFYASTVIIDGSKNNEIVHFPGRLTQYHAYIADSATKKAAAKLVEDWRNKIKGASPGYGQEKLSSKVQNRTTVGYRFSKVVAKELYTITIVSSKREIDDFYWVLLTVTRQAKAVLGDDGMNE